MDETARGIRGFLVRRWQTLAFAGMVLRFVFFFLTEGRRVRKRYAAARREGRTIWLDRGPSAEDPAEGPADRTLASAR